MSKPSKPKNPARKQYTPEFRTETLALAARVGIPEAARQLDRESVDLQLAQGLPADPEQCRGRRAAGGRECPPQAATGGAGRGARDPKKVRGVFRETPEVKYVLRHINHDLFSVKLMAQVFQVSRSGFYGWRAATERRAARGEATATKTPFTLLPHWDALKIPIAKVIAFAKKGNCVSP